MPLPPAESNDWATDVVDSLGVPRSVGALQSLTLWAVSEGMPAGAFNWLAATDPRPGSRPYNSAGVQAYPSYSVGVSVVVAKLSSALYRPILDALRTGQAEQVWQAINASPWCPGCQGGRYPEALDAWIAQQAGRGAPGLQLLGVAPPQQTGPKSDDWSAQVRHAGSFHHETGVALGHAADAIMSLVR